MAHEKAIVLQKNFVPPLLLKMWLRQRIFQALFFSLLLVFLNLAAAPAAYAASRSQATASPIVIDPHLLLTSIDPTEVELTTHTVDIKILYNGAFTLEVEALYRLHNPAEEKVTLPIQFAPDLIEGQPITFASNRLSNVSFLVDGQPGSIEQTGDALYATQVRFEPDQRINLQIRYQLAMPNSLLPQIRYSTYSLRKWPGVVSLRVNITAPEAVTVESRLRMEPSNWRYEITKNPRIPDIKWLYDEASLPLGPFVFQFIHPNHWARILESEAATQSGAPVRNFSLLGALYRQLYADPALSSINLADVDNSAFGASIKNDAKASAMMRDLFYVQAVAAYSGGIESSKVNGNAPAEDMIAAHVALALLYREQAAADVEKSATYAQLMASEATAAMRFMTADDERRQELSRWQFEGLYNIYTIERSKRNWPQAIALLQQLEAVITSNLSSEYINSQINADRIAEERRSITIYQALNLLEQGDQDGAFSLAGTQIANTELQPPATAQSLFSSWQITMTIRASSKGTDSAAVDGIDLDMVGITTPVRYQAAYTSLQELLSRWWTAGTSSVRPTISDVTSARKDQTNVPTVYQVSIPLASKEDARLLLQNMPEGDEWLLLRSLLSQIDPVITNDIGQFSQEIEVGQWLDLRAVGDQWNSVAKALEEQAERYKAIGSSVGDADAAAAEASLRARIQEVNYRNAAVQWQTLARDSWVLSKIEMQSSKGDESMSWLTTVVSPPQMRQLSTSHLITGPLYIISFFVLLGILLLTSLLWWLIGY